MPYAPGKRPSRAKVPGRGRGRPPKASQAAEAVQLAEATGAPLVEAAEQVGVGKSTAYAHQAAREAKRVPAQPSDSPVVAPGAPLERLRIYAAHDPDALAVLEQLDAPLALTTDPRQNALNLLAMLERDYRIAPFGKRGAIAEKITGALRELRQYFPPAPPPRPRDEVVEELRGLDGTWRETIEKPLAAIERRRSTGA